MGSRIEARAQTRWEQTRDIDGSRSEGEVHGRGRPRTRKGLNTLAKGLIIEDNLLSRGTSRAGPP